MSSRVQQLKEHIESGRHPDSFVPEDEQDDADPDLSDQSPGRGDSVTVAQCNAIRCAAQDGKNASEIAALFDFVDSRRTTHKHATGGCSHDDGIEAVMTTQITADDCQKIRSWYENTDMSQHDLADAVGKPRGTVRYHLNGRCAHTDD
jgi:ribosome-binding protein aMBF1 (putative translation factor)